MSLKYTSLALFIILLYSFSCGSFERKKEIISFLEKEKKLDIDSIEYLQVFILQDQICGACTSPILSFIYDLDHQNSLVIVSDENEKLIAQLISNIGKFQVFIDSSNLIERYGLRYAYDLIVVFRSGRVSYWSFIREEQFFDIKDRLMREK